MSGEVAESPAGSLRRVARNGTINLVALGLNAAFQLVAVFILARGLGRDGLGRYYAVYALVMFVQLVTEAGLATVLTRRIALAPGRWTAIAAEAAGMLALVVLASTAVLGGLGAFRAVLFGGGVAAWVAALAALVTCAAMHVQRFGAGVLQAFERLEYESAGRVVQGALFAALVAVLPLRDGAGFERALGALAFSHVVEAALVTACLQRRWRRPTVRLSRAQVRDWLAEAGPLGLGDVCRRMTWQLDTLLLSALQPPAVVGLYSIAYRPLGPLNWVPRAILTAAFPALSRMAEGDRDALARAFAASLRLLWVASLPFVVVISVCAEPLIVFLAGREYLPAAGPMRVLIWIAGLSFLSFQYRFLFTALGLRVMYARLVTLILLLEAGLELALIPRFGYFGACAGSVTGEFLFTALGVVYCYRFGVRGVDWWAMARAGLAAAAMAAALWAVRAGSLPVLFVESAVLSLLYLALCVALGAIRRDELGRLLHRTPAISERRGISTGAGTLKGE